MQVTNPLVNVLHTDLYQLTMAYAYWKSGHHKDRAVFDLFFRKCPFRGEYAVAAGISEAMNFVQNFKFTQDNIAYLREIMPECDEKFFTEYLPSIDAGEVSVYALEEGEMIFPRIPILRVDGPLAIAQLLETPLLNLINYPTLIATLARRMRYAVGPEKKLLEFGLRRAQGPDGALSGAHYARVGGFDATSNVLAGKLFDISVKGTHAHAFVSTFGGLNDISDRSIRLPDGGICKDFVRLVLEARMKLDHMNTQVGELAAFISYAQAFPSSFLALVDTYDTLRSGVPNFICVAYALAELGYRALGVRIDSGDLAYLSREARKQLGILRFSKIPDLQPLIVASNDIDETVLYSLKKHGHEIDVFGIGTALITCSDQPSLGCVYKLVEVNGAPRMKLSEDIGKATLPGKKRAFRLVGDDGTAIADVLAGKDENMPLPQKKILLCHPFDEQKRAFVRPSEVLLLHKKVDFKTPLKTPAQSIQDAREHLEKSFSQFREDHLRRLNPTPYKVSVSRALADLTKKLRLENSPASELY